MSQLVQNDEGQFLLAFDSYRNTSQRFNGHEEKQLSSPICKTASLRLHFSTCHVQERTCPSTSSPRLPGLLISHLVLTVCLATPNSVGRLTQLCTKESGMALFAEDWGSLDHLSV